MLRLDCSHTKSCAVSSEESQPTANVSHICCTYMEAYLEGALDLTFSFCFIKFLVLSTLKMLIMAFHWSAVILSAELLLLLITMITLVLRLAQMTLRLLSHQFRAFDWFPLFIIFHQKWSMSAVTFMIDCSFLYFFLFVIIETLSLLLTVSYYQSAGLCLLCPSFITFSFPFLFSHFHIFPLLF